MNDSILKIEVGDGVNTFYECNLSDKRGRIVFGVSKSCGDKKAVLDWVKENLPPLWIDQLDRDKIDVEKIKKEIER